jgi:hypothetical protein
MSLINDNKTAGSTLTFITYFLHDKNNCPKNDEWDVGRLAELVSIGIPLYIFVSSENADDIAFLQGATNIHIEVIEKSDLWVFRELSTKEHTLPEYCNVEKDTADYLAISHSKIELVSRAIAHNPWNTTHFAYIDFNITYLFWEKEKTYEYLRQFSKRSFFDQMLMFPGCSSPISMDKIHTLLDNIYWRFCGGFFVGDTGSLLTWWGMYKSYFAEYLDTYKKLTWDVNFWAWMETVKRWEPRWYGANHNDSIITAISADFITKNLVSLSRRVKHNYPVIPQFRPTSASYLKTSDGRRWLNTRYVNYWLYNNGCYGYPTSSHVIENKNMLCELGENMDPIVDTFVIMDENIDIPEFVGDVYSRGLEDIRLFTGVDESSVRFIATNVNYSPNGKNNMMVGDYSILDHSISNVKHIKPPLESWCEKNWIPIVYSGDGHTREKYIYKWFPLEIGQVNPETGSLEITQTYNINAPYFDKVRGSTVFIERADGYLGVVHFSEDHNPRHYYHMLVLLEKDTLKPLKYSNCFCFKSLGVEFCIGFSDELEDYVFWTSQMDRDPMTVFIAKSHLPLCFSF